MNTDYTKPPVAPKPRLHCHASLRLPSLLMSRAVCATRGPKPPVAPKPIVPHDLNVRELLLSGPQEGCSNGGLFASDEELEQDNEPEDILTWACKNQALVKSKLGFYSIRPGQKPVQNGLTEEGGAFKQELAEHWRDSAAEDALEVHGLTADSSVTDGDMVDHVDAGEALADADGLSVGDLSVSSISEEELRSDSGTENRHLEDTVGKLQWQEDEGTKFSADEMTDSLIQQHVTPGNNSNTELSLSESTEEEEVKDHNDGVTCYTSKEECSHELKKRTKEFQAYSAINEEHINIDDIIPAYQKQLLDTNERHSDLEVDAFLEPYYISSEDIIGRRFSLMSDKGNGLAYGSVVLQKLLSNNVVPPSKDHGESQSGESILTRQTVRVSSEGHMETDTNNEYDRDNNMSTASPRQTRISSRSQAREVVNAEASLDDYQPRFRLVSISVPTEADTSMSSSFSESQLMSPNDTGDDLDGHMAPFLDDTTDSERYLSDEHVYEEAGHDSEGENVLSFNNRDMVMRSSSLSTKGPDYVKGTGSEVNIQKYSVGGYGLTSPTMSSSPLLNSVRTKSYSEPPRLAIYPRSYSMEGRDASLCVYKETHSFPQEERRREHALSLSYALNASGSFSQRSPAPSSGLSTPTSLVDIPPPFELACITKKPITKSFPSLLIEGDSPDKTKKKKSAFKRFLLLKFRRKADAKPAAQAVSPSSSRASTESSHSAPSRLLDVNKKTGGSPRPVSRCGSTLQGSSEHQSTLSFYKDGRRIGGSVAFLSRSVVRVESFEDRSKLSFVHVPLTKPRSISFPNTDAASDYENIPAVSSDYENIQVPRQRSVRQETFTEFFDRPSRARSSANETDGYVDMSSLPGFERNTRSTADETESAYTEAYNVCSMAVGPSGVPPAEEEEETAADEDQGRTSEEEDGGIDSNYDRRPDGRPRAFYIAKELVDTEKLHVEGLKRLQEDFREAVKAAVGEEGNPVLEEERLREILNELPDVYALHCTILTELENRIETWEEGQRIAEVLLSRKSQFLAYTTYIGHYDRSMTLLEESCRTSPAFAAVVRQFEQQKPAGGNISLQHQLLQVIVRVAQYRMLLTDYLNNLSPDSKEYEDTQAAVAIVSDIADQANDSLRNGDNLLRLVNIEYSVRGQRDLLKPGRVFVKEGTLMKVSRKSRQPRHLFLMNDVLLYTYPQQDGKYRLKNTLSLTRMKITKPNIDNAQNALKIEGTDISIILLASSCSERDDWLYTLTRAVTEHERGAGAFTASGEARERLWMTSLGEKAPTLVPVSQAMMCMNCTADFSLTLRRHHCHACGRIVCRSCSRNRYPLKYMKDRLAKVCDHCYSELRKRGEDVSVLTNRNSPRLNHSSRPLSAVFQNIHPPSLWRHRKGTASFNPVTVSEEGSISGSLQRSKQSKRHWKRLWFLLKDKVLYTYRAKEEKVASETLPLLGFTVKLPDRQDWVREPNVFQLYHKKTLYYTFKAEDNYTAQRWVNAMEEATVL